MAEHSKGEVGPGGAVNIIVRGILLIQRNYPQAHGLIGVLAGWRLSDVGDKFSYCRYSQSCVALGIFRELGLSGNLYAKVVQGF